jgi:hypothetical protein
MTATLSPALMSEEDDLRRLPAQESRIMGWLRAHVDAAPPPVHRYAGVLTIQDGSLTFRGIDLLEERDCQRIMPLHAITEVRLGLAHELKGNHRGSFVDGEPRPLVVRHLQDGQEVTSYFVTNFPGLSRRVDGNRHWRDVLLQQIRQEHNVQPENWRLEAGQALT